MDEEKGISFAEILKVIFKKIWWAVGVTAVFTLAFVLVVQFWLNYKTQVYVIKFDMYFPGMESGVYPNGTTYRLYDLVSEDVLLEIQSNSNGALDSIDISKMCDNDGISIESVSHSEESGVRSDEYYFITISKQYVGNAKLAAQLVKAIANYPLVYTKRSLEKLNYDSYLLNYENGNYVDYDGKINYLIEQKDYLLEMYDALILATNADYTVEYENSQGEVSSLTLSQYRSVCSMVLNDAQVFELQSELAAERYHYDADSYVAIAANRKSVLNTQKGYLVNQRNQLIAERDALCNTIVGAGGSGTIILELESYNNRIIELGTQINEIEVELAEIDKNLAALANDNSAKEEAFNAKLDSYYAQLQEQTRTFKNIRMNVYDEEAYVRIMTNKVEAEGGMNIVLAAVVGAVVGFLSAGIVICIIDVPKYLKEREGRATANGADVREEDKS